MQGRGMSVFPPIRKVVAPADADDLPSGLRLSESCAVKRIRQEFAPGEYAPFHEGVGHRGHVIAAEFARHSIRAKNIELEVPIAWAHGISHIDVVADGCALELKSVRERTPADSHISQVQRMMYAWEASGREPMRAWGIILVDPITYTATGPFQVHLTPKRRDEIRVMLTATDDAMKRLGNGADVNDPATYQNLECSCGGCFDTGPQGDIPQAVDDLAATLDYLQQQERELSSEVAAVKAQIAAAMRPGDKYELNYLAGTVSLSKPRERVQIAWAKAAAAGVVPDAVVDAVIDAGYQSTVETKPFVSLRVKDAAMSSA